MATAERARRAVQAPSLVSLKRGSLYLSMGLCERYFRGLSTVILLRREDDLLIMPVHDAAAGGYLLKLRNTKGDRVVNAMDFFREHGVDDFYEADFEAVWNSDLAALQGANLFKYVN